MAFKLSEDSEDEIIMSEINMTPLIDVMLVLLIIFMVTSSVSVESGLDIDLPKSQVEKTPQNIDEVIIVSISAKGNIAVQGIKTSKEEFIDILRKQIDGNEDKTVLFEGDKSVTLDTIISIIDQARQIGAFKFAIATDSK